MYRLLPTKGYTIGYRRQPHATCHAEASGWDAPPAHSYEDIEMRTQIIRLARRVREVREQLYGADGAPALAADLGLPARTWSNYERGIPIPADVLLRFLDTTGASPRWLLSGEGDRLDRESTRPDPPGSNGRH